LLLCAAFGVLVGCGEQARPQGPAAAPLPRPILAAAPSSAPRTARPVAPVIAPVAPAAGARWLKGSTHVHAKPSGDSSTEIVDVIAWYQRRGYDFIALTDHNQVSELPGGATFGQIAVSAPADGRGLIVLAGIELTHNPATCIPAPPLPEGKCRVHVNGLGVTARPEGKLEWADRKSFQRIDLYSRALVTARELGGLVQLNHPQWHWGIGPGLLTELGKRGALFVEVANSQFTAWNDGGQVGTRRFPSIEALWDAALLAGVTMWGVASDDAHAYDGKGQYPAGGGWVVVYAERQPKAILAALAAGSFYSSTGVVLERAGRQGDELVVEVSAQSAGGHRIAFLENGVRVVEQAGTRAARKLPAKGYVRAVVTREDGARAWVQPVRR
jgi:hypothetical protein